MTDALARLMQPSLPIRWPFSVMQRWSSEDRRRYVALVTRAVASEHAAARAALLAESDRALDETIAHWIYDETP
jgi:hypothetical protein